MFKKSKNQVGGKCAKFKNQLGGKCSKCKSPKYFEF